MRNSGGANNNLNVKNIYKSGSPKNSQFIGGKGMNQTFNNKQNLSINVGNQIQ